MASDIFPQIGTPQQDRGNAPLPGADERSVFTRPVTGPSPADFLNDINYKGLEKFGAATQDTFNDLVIKPKIDEAAQEGAASVARDPVTGEIKVGPPHEDLTVFGRAYNDAANKTYVLQTDAQNKTAIQQIYLDHPDDPQGAKILADKYVMATAQKAPEAIRASVLVNGTQTSEEYLRGSVLNKHELDIAKYKGTAKAAIDDASDTFVSLAGTPGGANTPNFAQAHAAMVKGWLDLAANPLSGITPAMADREITLTEKRAQAEAILSHQQYGTQGLLTVQNAIVGSKAASGHFSEADAHSAIGSLFPGATITSEQRTPEHNAAVGGVPNSMHLSGQAVDFVLPKGTTFADVKAGLKAKGLPVSELIDEGDHVHWGWGGKGAKGGKPVQREQGQAETAAEIQALHLPPDETLALIRRSEGILSDADTKRRQATEDTQRLANLQSTATMHAIYEKWGDHTLTPNMVEALKDNLTSSDYHTAQVLANGGGAVDNPNTVADLTLALDTASPDEFKKAVTDHMRLGDLTTSKGLELIGKNETAAKDDRPSSPYKRGREFLKNSLDVNPFGSGNDYGAKKQIQANALAEYDDWDAQHPGASAQEHMAEAGILVHRHNMLDAAITPNAIGAPYGYRGVLSAVTDKDVQAAAQKLKADRDAGRLGPLQFQNEVEKLKSWQSHLAKQAANKPKAPQ